MVQLFTFLDRKYLFCFQIVEPRSRSVFWCKVSCNSYSSLVFRFRLTLCRRLLRWNWWTTPSNDDIINGTHPTVAISPYTRVLVCLSLISSAFSFAFTTFHYFLTDYPPFSLTTSFTVILNQTSNSSVYRARDHPQRDFEKLLLQPEAQQQWLNSRSVKVVPSYYQVLPNPPSRLLSDRRLTIRTGKLSIMTANDDAAGEGHLQRSQPGCF
jgi:hypothetical protein